MESESGNNAKLSESGYSKSCSNSNSQRSASSKSRHSGSNSSGSSGYCGAVADGSINTQNPPNKRNKDHKKKDTTITSTSLNIGLKDTNTEHQIESTPTKITDIAPIPEWIESKIELNTGEAQNTLQAESQPSNGILSKCDHLDQSIEGGSTENNECEPLTEKWYTPVTYSETKIPNQPDNGFCCVVSMYDGVVLFTTPNLTPVLGFPKNMWLGRSFVDFVHPKDRETFSKHITKGIASPLVDSTKCQKGVKNTLFACLRKYRGLNSGYGVIEKAVTYEAFQLTITFRNIADTPDTKCTDRNAGMFLVVVAVPVHSSYDVPNQTKNTIKFGMRHTSACTFSHVDPDVVTNFGYLPQDMIGKSVFDFYHPDDMPFLKEIYETIINMCQKAGSVFISKPYRFAVQNGGFAMIETEWSSYVNPWSRKLEFVIGLNRVLQGPKNPNIFEAPINNDMSLISEEVLKESKLIQDEILYVLNKELFRPSEAAKQEVSKRCKDLAMFMESLMEEVSKSNLKLAVTQHATISERCSVILGGISPHNEYHDSISSSDTPLSYNQLNYNENIQRFFKSEPTTVANDCPGPLQSGFADVEYEAKIEEYQKCLSPVPNCSTSGSGSPGNTYGSNQDMSGTTVSFISSDFYKVPHLTQNLLLRHNEDMEKAMAKIHRSQKTHNKVDREIKKSNFINHKKFLEGNNNNHGVKRSGSHSFDGDCHKVSKHIHPTAINYNENANNEKLSAVSPNLPLLNDVNLWPPFSVTMTPLNNTLSSCISTTPNTVTNVPGLFPIYFHPTQKCSSLVRENSPGPGYLENYFPLLPTSPYDTKPLRSTISNNSDDYKSVILNVNRPSSQATSIKAEPGSAKGMSEYSRKGLGLQSPCSPNYSINSSLEADIEIYNITKKTSDSIDSCEQENKHTDNQNDEGSSTSSFYSSFLKTDGSLSNDDSVNQDISMKSIKSNDDTWSHYPMRKRDPPWLENVNVTPDLVYRYQVYLKNIDEILASDLSAMKEIPQPNLVNDQLNQLYIEMELEGVSNKLTLEEGITSSSSSGEDNHSHLCKTSTKKCHSYGSLMKIFKENAPFPSSEN